MNDSDSAAGDLPSTTFAVQRLLAQRAEFVAFVQRRVGDAALAEDLVQDAFVRWLEKGHELRAGEAARAWFYRVLRNAVIDRARRADAGARAVQKLAEDLADRQGEAAAELDRVACSCIAELADLLPPEQADALRRIELEGRRVVDYAADAGISESNAGVRVHRARTALRREVTRACGACAEHGCLDCSCRRSAP